MSVEKRIDDLINAGWHVLDSDFDVTAFKQWRKMAADCLDTLLGPDHTYTRHFKDYVSREERNGILAAGGILTAARETVGGSGNALEAVLPPPARRDGNGVGVNQPPNHTADPSPALLLLGGCRNPYE